MYGGGMTSWAVSQGRKANARMNAMSRMMNQDGGGMTSWAVSQGRKANARMDAMSRAFSQQGGKPLGPCPPGKIRNVYTNRCVTLGGKVAQNLTLTDQQLADNVMVRPI